RKASSRRGGPGAGSATYTERRGTGIRRKRTTPGPPNHRRFARRHAPMRLSTQIRVAATCSCAVGQCGFTARRSQDRMSVTRYGRAGATTFGERFGYGLSSQGPTILDPVGSRGPQRWHGHPAGEGGFLSLFWRIFLLNAAVLVTGAALLLLGPL